MKCEICKINDATVSFRERINDKETMLSLCHECAAKKEKEFSSSLFELADPFGKGFFSPFFTSKPAKIKVREEKRCTLCGSVFADLLKWGRVGCSNCYVDFSEELRPTLERLHGKVLHTGRAPKRFAVSEDDKASNESSFTESEAQRLERELRLAVEREDYELAATLRDRLRELGER